MESILMIIYISLMLGHVILYINKKKTYAFVILTSVFLFFLMSGHKYVGNGDAIDFFGYWYGYTNFDLLVQKDFWFYYIFYSSQKIGVLLSLDFYQWWAVMTAISLYFIVYTIRKRNYNPHVFFFFFMIYYVFLFYGGLKFYYGFCVFQYAFSFLLSGEKKDKLKFILLTLISGGFHVMYYMFLILGLVNLKVKNRKVLLKISIIITILLSVYTALSGRNLLNFMQSIIDSLENERLSTYFSIRTNLGYLLPIGIHILTTVYAFNYRKIMKKKSNYNSYMYANTIFYANLITVAFYPLFMIALTFMRLLTSLSLTTIIASGYNQDNFSKLDRVKMIGTGLVLIGLFYFINVFLNGYWYKTIMPFFDSYYFKWW